MSKKSSLKILLLAALSLGAALPSTAMSVNVVTSAISDSDRPQTDVERDAMRKPAELMYFANLQPGARVMDLMPGGGYFTRIFAKIVGSKGQVYTLVPAGNDKLSDKFRQMLKSGADGMTTLAKSYSNLSLLNQDLDKLALPANLDMVWTSQNYHDVYAYWGPATAAKLDAAVFKALKKGGLYMIVDHVGMPGDDVKTGSTLHRIDPATVKKQVQAAGFEFVGESPLLRNAQDNHQLSVFDPSLRGHTDQFVLKFRKP